MKLPRNVGVVDLGVLTVVLVLVLLPAREMYSSTLHKGEPAEQLAIALAEARTVAAPADGGYVADYARRLGEAGFKDWAIEVSTSGAKRAHAAPTEWRALLAVSVAYIEKLDVVPALDYADQALTACRTVRTGCPSWEEVRMRLYQEHLDAGVKSGIDPRRDPIGFRAAGESALRSIRLKHHERERDPAPILAPAPVPTP